MAVAVAATFSIFMVFIPESKRIEPRPPEVTWITTFAADRSDEEIIASNVENQKRQDAIRAEQARRAELRRELYRELGRATGLDVDALERQYSDDPAPQSAPARETVGE